jgi:Ca2+-binding RTX toxin-like protein
MTAVLVVSGYLGAVSNSNANDEDRITVNLKQGETLNLDHNLAPASGMEYSVNGGAWIALADGQTLTATSDGVYQIHAPTSPIVAAQRSGKLPTDHDRQLRRAHDIDAGLPWHLHRQRQPWRQRHGQRQHQLSGRSHLTGTGDDMCCGGQRRRSSMAVTAMTCSPQAPATSCTAAGNDLLYSGPGNDLLDGGIGIDTASYAHATAGVTVNLSLLGAQNTIGAGTDTLTGIENLIGSNFNDTLTGDNNNNVINGGLGNDVLNGGGGDDLLIGGMGNNTLTGGAGRTPSSGSRATAGHDTITDFTPAPTSSTCRNCCKVKTPPRRRWMTTCTSPSAAAARRW